MTRRQHLALNPEAHGLDPADGSWWALRAVCLRCGGPLAHVTDGAPQEAGTHLSIVAQCTTCASGGSGRSRNPLRYLLTAHLRPV